MFMASGVAASETIEDVFVTCVAVTVTVLISPVVCVSCYDEHLSAPGLGTYRIPTGANKSTSINLICSSFHKCLPFHR